VSFVLEAKADFGAFCNLSLTRFSISKPEIKFPEQKVVFCGVFVERQLASFINNNNPFST
jgi:hypothetical protein